MDNAKLRVLLKENSGADKKKRKALAFVYIGMAVGGYLNSNVIVQWGILALMVCISSWVIGRYSMKKKVLDAIALDESGSKI